MMNSKSKTNKTLLAFTLAEVLITLMIIGIVAELTIPNLAKNIQDTQYKIGLKKAYSEISQAYLSAQVDNGGGFGAYSCDATTTLAKFSAIEAKLKRMKSCSAGNVQGQCWSNTPTQPNVAAGCDSFISTAQYNNDAFTTSDGMNWLKYASGGGGCSLIAVDVNGNKTPNQWGKDVWTFMVSDTTISIGGCLSGMTLNGTNAQDYEVGVITGKY